MANREVNLTKRVKTALGLRYCPVVLSANGRVKPDVVLVSDKEERHPEGAYYLEWREGSKRVRLSVGEDPADASARRLRKEAELNAVNNGVAVGPDNGNGQRSLAATVAEYLEETKLTKKQKTLAAYSTSLMYFQESCSKLYLEDIERRDLLKFSAFLRDEKEQAPRSCWNKFANVMSFLKANGIRGLVKKNDWPRFVEEEPEVYEKKNSTSCSEADIVIFDMVDGPPRARPGMLFRDDTGMRLVNVAVTRARGKLIFIAHKDWVHESEPNQLGVLWNIFSGVLLDRVFARSFHLSRIDLGLVSTVVFLSLLSKNCCLRNFARDRGNCPLSLSNIALGKNTEGLSREPTWRLLVVSSRYFATELGIICSQIKWQRDLKQRREVTRLGWRVLAFTGSEITANVASCVDQIVRTTTNQ